MPDDSLKQGPDQAAVDAVVAGFRKRLKERRIRSDLTISQAARRAGVEPSYWGKVERGVADPGIANLLRMQYALGLDTLEPLFDRTSLDALSAQPASESEAA